jgi:hypothetical protein
MIYYLPVVIVFVLVCITAINLHSLCYLSQAFIQNLALFFTSFFKVHTLASWVFGVISSILLSHIDYSL